MKKIKVCLDVSQTAHMGGVAVYTNQLAEELAKIDDIDLIPLYYSLRKPYNGSLKNVKSIKIPPSVGEFLFNRLRLPTVEDLVGAVNIFHSSDWTQPKTKAKKVTTYHDVIPLKHPQWSKPSIVAVHKRRLRIVEKEIDIVIAVSESTKKDLLECSSIPEDKIKVVYEAANKSFKPYSKEEVELFRKKHNLPDNFLLAIGGIGGRRNLEKIKKAATGHQLIITGENLIGITFEEMPLLYNAADALVYCSLYEGFGLPILEAMQSGTPVVTSNRSSMKEIAGDAAVLVDPEDNDSIRDGVKKALGNTGDYRQKGLLRAKEFNWEKCAEQTAVIYRELHERS